MTMFEAILLGLLGYICVYAVIHRVCCCFETCSKQKYCSKTEETDVITQKN